ncbi:hypothetical protein [Streptomyces monashensis]|uniref:Uncharacterized protein n=1 Tax=Streptomyces monashensis TaxID=1678012 RepID=A0A1S2QQ26_9ACTN|nr:hypothetical protein [Streptomyces monashensis]OIK08204.1 hypothetical protein BIV23_00200 [Streptomyces monashensis]
MTDKRFAIIRGAFHTGREFGRWWDGCDLSNRWLHARWLNAQYVAWFNRRSQRVHDAEATVKELEAAYAQAEEDANPKKRDKIRERIIEARELRDTFRAEEFNPLPFTEDDLNDTLKKAVRRRWLAAFAVSVAVGVLTRFAGGVVIIVVGGVLALVFWVQGRWPHVLDPAPKLRDEINPALMAPEEKPAEKAEPEPVDRTAAVVDTVRRGIGSRNGVHLADLIEPLSKLGALSEGSVSGVRTALHAVGVPTKDSVKLKTPDGSQSVKEGVNAREFEKWLNVPEPIPAKMPIGASGYILYPNGRPTAGPSNPSPPPSDSA